MQIQLTQALYFPDLTVPEGTVLEAEPDGNLNGKTFYKADYHGEQIPVLQDEMEVL